MKEVSQTSVPPGGPYTIRRLGPMPCRGPEEFMATRSLLLGHYVVLDDVYIVAACPTLEAAEAACRLLAGPARPRTIVRAGSGEPSAILVSRDECDRWRGDPELRKSVSTQIREAGVRYLPIATEGGSIVDIYSDGLLESEVC